MRNDFDYFIKKIPVNIHNNTKTVISRHMAIFIPDRFITERKMSMKDYHFVVLYSSPPPFTIGGKRHECKKGSLICMEPELEITVHSQKDTPPAKYMSFCVNKEFFEDIAHEVIGSKNVKFASVSNAYSRQLLDFAEYLIQEIVNFGESNPLMIDCLEKQIVIQVLRDSGLDSTIYSNTKTEERNYVEQAIQYIKSYYSSNISINEICKAIYVSPSYFQRIFKNSTNKTPYQYIMEFRYEKAKELLKNSHFSIEEISRLCGFVSSGHFSTEFKRREGAAPLDYRKLMKNMS